MLLLVIGGSERGKREGGEGEREGEERGREMTESRKQKVESRHVRPLGIKLEDNQIS